MPGGAESCAHPGDSGAAQRDRNEADQVLGAVQRAAVSRVIRRFRARRARRSPVLPPAPDQVDGRHGRQHRRPHHHRHWPRRRRLRARVATRRTARSAAPSNHGRGLLAARDHRPAGAHGRRTGFTGAAADVATVGRSTSPGAGPRRGRPASSPARPAQARPGSWHVASTPPGLVELSVRHPETDERQVLARRRVRPPGAVAQRLLPLVRERLAHGGRPTRRRARPRVVQRAACAALPGPPRGSAQRVAAARPGGRRRVPREATARFQADARAVRGTPRGGHRRRSSTRGSRLTVA